MQINSVSHKSLNPSCVPTSKVYVNIGIDRCRYRYRYRDIQTDTDIDI